jgi:hypothetical protein
MAGKSDIYWHFERPVRPVPQIARFHPVQLRMIADLAALIQQRRRKPPGTAAAPIPADPNKPNTLSGGAAAPLEFD